MSPGVGIAEAASEAARASAPQVSPQTESPQVTPAPAQDFAGLTTEANETVASSSELSPATIDAIARRVVEQMSEKVVREIAWEVVPDLAELLIKQKIAEDK